MQRYEVVRIEVVPSSGHVYDLLTETGWLLADGMIAHNSARDERVRPTHVHADSQEIPANLRYQLPKIGNAPGVDLARRPRDSDLPVGQAINCRCDSVPLPDAIARQIHDTETVIAGTRVRASVVCEYHRIVESEFPDRADTGGRWLGGAAAEVARVRRARRR